MSQDRKFKLSFDARRIMKAVSICAQPREACGLIVPREFSPPGFDAPWGFYPARNVSEVDDKYSVDPEAHRRIYEMGALRGVFHSHVLKSSLPSLSDIAMASPNLLYVIYSVFDDAFGAWMMVADGVGRTVQYCDIEWC